MRVIQWLKKFAAPSGEDRGALGLRVFIYALMAIALWILVFGDKPWRYSEEVAALKEQGKKLDLRHHVSAGLFYGSLINLFLGGLVLFLRRFWARRLPPPMVRRERHRGQLPAQVFWIGVLLAVVLAGTLRLHFAKGSLWWDELWNIKHTMSGEFRPDMKKGGELRFREVPWEKSVYYYRKPTNHPPMAIASRLSLETWRKSTGAGREEFDELAVRAPSLFAGLVSVAAIAILLRSWGFGSGGLVAAILLALHPWHARYGVDARAYSFAVLWTILGCLWLGQIMRTCGRAWGYWMLFGLNQAMFVWSLPNGIYYAFAFGVAALIFCLRQPAEGGRRLTLLARLVAVNAAAAMFFILLFLPNALQIREWGEINDHHYLSGDVLKNVATQLAFGMEVAWGKGVETEGLTSFRHEMAAQPLWGWVAMTILGVALVGGMVALWRGKPQGLGLCVAVACGAGLSLLVTWGLHQHFYHRYVVAYLIVPLVALVGIGAVEVANVVRPRSRSTWLSVLTALLVLGSFSAFTRAQRVVLSTRSYAPFREVAEFVGREAKVQATNVIGYGLGGRVFLVYYPEGKFADTLEELDALLAEAAQRGGPTLVVCGYMQFNQADPGSAAGTEKLLDGELFEEVAAFPGIDPLFYFRVMRSRQN